MGLLLLMKGGTAGELGKSWGKREGSGTQPRAWTLLDMKSPCRSHRERNWRIGEGERLCPAVSDSALLTLQSLQL